MMKLSKLVFTFVLRIGCCTAFLVPWQFASRASAAPGDLLFTLAAPDPQAGAGFGETLAVVNGNVIVGEPNRRFPGMSFVGRAYLFDGQTGALRLTLDEPEPERFESRFGQSLAAGDGNIFVGSNSRIYGLDATTGNVRLQINEPLDGDSSFASNIAYDGAQLLVSEPSYSTAGLQGIAVGRAHTYDAATGQLRLTLPNPEPSRQEAFGIGYSLAFFGDKLAVGSFPDNSFAGRVWVFDRFNGQTLFTLDNPNPEARTSDWFSWSVAANEKLIVVSADEDSTNGLEGSGAVYIFDAVTGALRHTLFSPQPEIDGEFGRQVTLTPDGDVLVGAWGESVNGIKEAGRAYLFDGDTGTVLLSMANPEPQVSFGFGWSVSVTDEALIVGAPLGADSQRVYAFQAIPEPKSVVLTCSMILTVLGNTVVRRWVRAPGGAGKEA